MKNILLMIILSAFSFSSFSAEKVKLKLSVMEKDSRIKIGSQVIELNTNFKPQVEKLKMKSSLDGYSINVVSKDVNVNGIAGNTWVEVTLSTSDSKEVAYITATIPKTGFAITTAGTGFIDPVKKSEYVLVLQLE